MIRFATSNDVPTLVQLLHKFCEAPPYNTRAYDPEWIQANLEAALASEVFDVVICEDDGVWLGAACASQQPTLLCPEWEYHEHFVVALHPSATRSLVRWLMKRGKERECFRTVIGSTTMNDRYERLVQVAGELKPYGKTFVKEN
jgi:hypothetical protein